MASEPLSILKKLDTAATLELSVVIPAYNEALRLPLTLRVLAKSISAGRLNRVNIVQVLVVDDGSTDGTSEIARDFKEKLPSLEVITNRHNRGKGAVVQQGMLASRAEWILVVDADMATPWDEINRLAEACQSRGAMIAIGSRRIRGLSRVQSSPFRSILRKLFNLFIRGIARLDISDTQCGFKLCHRESTAHAVGELRERRFAWDVEFLMLAADDAIPIEEVAVRWRAVDGSKVRPIRDGLSMLWSVIRIRAKRLLS